VGKDGCEKYGIERSGAAYRRWSRPCGSVQFNAYRSKDISALHMDDPSAVVHGSTNDSITGRVKAVSGLCPAPGQKLVLTLEDGRRLTVLTDLDGKIRATGGFF
jgi:hypothetical protein